MRARSRPTLRASRILSIGVRWEGFPHEKGAWEGSFILLFDAAGTGRGLFGSFRFDV